MKTYHLCEHKAWRTLSEMNQVHKDKYQMISFTYGIKKNIDMVKVESRIVVTRDWGARRGRWEGVG